MEIAPVEQPVAPSPAPKKNLLIGWVALIVLLAGGAALAYFYYPASPEKVAAQMAKKMAETNSVEFSIDMDMEVNAALPEGLNIENRQIKILNEFDGAFDSSELNNPKFYGVMRLAGEGLVFSLDLRAMGKVFYFKLNEAPFLGFIDPGKIKNQWIRVDTAELEKDLGLPEQEYSLTEEQKKLITALYENSKILKLEERLNSEKISNVSTEHYRFSIDKQELKTFLGRVLEITNKELAAEDKAEFEKLLDQVEFDPGEIWIGRKDKLPYKLSMGVAIRPNSANPSSGKINWSAELKNYNHPMTVEAPSNSKSFEELFSDAFGALTPQQELLPIPIN